MLVSQKVDLPWVLRPKEPALCWPHEMDYLEVTDNREPIIIGFVLMYSSTDIRVTVTPRPLQTRCGR